MGEREEGKDTKLERLKPPLMPLSTTSASTLKRRNPNEQRDKLHCPYWQTGNAIGPRTGFFFIVCIPIRFVYPLEQPPLH